MLRLECDPKLAWALAHPERFPGRPEPRAARAAAARAGPRREGGGPLLLARRVRRVRCDDLRACTCRAQGAALRAAGGPPSAAVLGAVRRCRRTPQQAALF
jgi:predicted DNA-binding helix-hairpin-helix protein